MKQTPPPAFNEKESAILVTLYEQPDSNYNAYDLAQTLNPTVRAGTPEFGTAFTRVCEATEELILRDFVQGKRLRGADGIYFGDLKLTRKGEQTAIQERRRIAELKKSLPEIVERSNAVVSEMNEFNQKKKK